MITPLRQFSLFCLLFTSFLFQSFVLKGEWNIYRDSISITALESSEIIPVKVSEWMHTELGKAKRKTLLSNEQFFTKDTAKIVGYIKGYSPELGFKTIIVNVTNDLRNGPGSVVSEIDYSGRFTCTIPMSYPKKATISLGEKFFSLYLEPGQVLALGFDWKDCVKTDGFRNVKDPSSILYLEGPLAKLNYELFTFHLRTMGYRHYWVLRTHTPQQYLEVMDSILLENEGTVTQALKEGDFSKKCIEIQKNEALIANGFYLIDYAFTKNEEGIQMPSDFYKMLNRLPLNEPSGIISNYAPFINRFEVNPVMTKGYAFIKNLNENYSNFKQSEICLKVWNAKDSLLQSDLKLSSGFAYESTKIRHLSDEIQKMEKNEAYAYYSKLQEGIKNPYLRQEGLGILINYFGKEDLNKNTTDQGVQLPSVVNRQQKWIPYSLPVRKDVKLFNTLVSPYKGKYLFVDFWGTTCGPCRWGIEQKREIRDKYKDNGIFEFVFITCNRWSPDKNTYEKYVEKQNLEHSLYISNDEFNFMMQLFHFTGVPHYLFIDPEGNVLDADFDMIFGFEEARNWIEAR